MKSPVKILSVSLMLFFMVGVLTAQNLERPNLIWARSTDETIVLDGQLTETSWAVAESIKIVYGETSALLGGSGYRIETGVEPIDPTEATIKFLVNGNNLYMAVHVKDQSVGGGMFNKFDGFLMNMRDHSSPNRPAPNFEYFYGWVTESWADPATGEVGAEPGFFGWASGDREVWDAKTVVHGISNSDTLMDEGYTVEIMFNLTPRGYDVTTSEGDIIEFNISIYDADWQWPLDIEKFSGTRTWWQGPWGNASAYDVVRIFARPDVTVSSGPVPVVGPELVIPNGVNFPAPVIDGMLDDEIWANIEGFDIRYGDDDLRASYSGIGPYRSGQYQPAIDGVTAAVLDPGDATIKMFFKDSMLYIGVDVRDQAVWGLDTYDLWDGVKFIINDRVELDAGDHNMVRRNLTARVGADGQLVVADYLMMLLDSLGGAEAALALKPNTTVGDYNDVDEGYQIEMALNLTRFGYPQDRDDGALLISATLFDGEKFANASDNYGTRTWWFRESDWPAAPAWAYMDPDLVVTSIDDKHTAQLPETFRILGNYPNPFNAQTTIRYALPQTGQVTLDIYNLLGQVIVSKVLGNLSAGMQEVSFDASALSSGLYFYKLSLKANGKQISTQAAKMLLIK